jgi:protein SCO1/2
MKKILPAFFIFTLFTYAVELHGSVKDFPKKIPVLDKVVSDDGKYFDFSQLKGKVLLITYGYTSCPHVCPTMLSYLKEVETVLNGKGYKDMYRIIFISVDPVEDDPERLSSYKKFSGMEDFVFITGRYEDLEKVWKAFNVYVDDKGYTELEDGSHTVRLIDHTAKLTVVDKKGYIREEFLGMYIPVEKVVKDVITLIEE